MRSSIPVIIAGAGPTGLTLSKLLSQLGINNLLLESAPALTKHPQVSNDPIASNLSSTVYMYKSMSCMVLPALQAHFINNRTMEIFRQMRGTGGNIAAEVVKLSPPLREWRKFIYCESMTGNILGEVDHFKVHASLSFAVILLVTLARSCQAYTNKYSLGRKGQDGPRMHHLSPEPVAHLSQHRLLPILLRSATASDALADLRFGHAVSRVEHLPSGNVLLTVAEKEVWPLATLLCTVQVLSCL